MRSLYFKLMALVAVPMFLAVSVLTVFSAVSISKGMSSESLKGLCNLAESVEAAYDGVSSGDYELRGEYLYKGDYNITENTGLLDSFVDSTDAEVTLFFGNTRRATSIKDKSGSRIVGTKASEEVSAAVLGGSSFESTSADVNGESFYAYYLPLKNSDGKTAGMLFCGVPSSEMESFVASRVIQIICTALLITAAAVCFGIFVVRRIIKALNKAEGALAGLGEGELCVDFDEGLLNRRDELGSMVRSMDTLSGKLSGVVESIRKSAGELLDEGASLEDASARTSQASGEIAASVEGIAKGAVSQAEEVESATSEVGSMGDMIDAVMGEAVGLNTVVDEMSRCGERCARTIMELTDSSNATIEGVSKIADSVARTNECVEDIHKAVDMITSIASQTSLLSLNASIEAARAGDAGRGFAVVASEIQKLAKQSGDSAEEIECIIKSLMEASQTMVDETKGIDVYVKEQQDKLSVTHDELQSLSSGIQSTSDASRQIRESISVCDASKGRIVDIIANLSAISEENAASAEETNASVEELAATIEMLSREAKNLVLLGQGLSEALSFFK